ncbi:MAG: hypothetical protein FJ137_19860 [Deltaproteobacteria bacterium]|nr:hypothetical protein [Deltaproteobacteria bacterium]
MRRPLSVVVVALAVVVGASAACHTDEPRRGDDAGALTSPSSTAPPSPTPSAATSADAGVVVDAGSDATGAVPVVDAVVDAGHLSDAPATGTATTMPTGAVGIGRPPPVKVDPITVTIFNRVLAKTKTRDLNPGQVQELAASLTGQKVERARRTAGTFWLIQFAPTTPPRGKAEQQQLIAQLKAGGDFEFVEADQVMTVK